MASVAGSVAKRSRRSPISTSAISPAETMPEKPMPRASAESSIAVTSAPLCEMSASPPGLAFVLAKVALSLLRGETTPRQLGPTILSSWGFALSSMRWRRPLSSVRPAVRTTTHLAPIAPKLSTTTGTVSAGVITRAMSGAAVSWSMEGDQCVPARSTRRGLITSMRPAKPPSITLSSTILPSEPERSDPPTRAMLPGVRSTGRLRIDIADPFLVRSFGTRLMSVKSQRRYS